jgi:hypothetical protein
MVVMNLPNGQGPRGMFAPDATSTDPKRDGSKFWAGAHVWRRGEPVTITWDNGVFYDWVEGHVVLQASNDRSPLTLTEPQ